MYEAVDPKEFLTVLVDLMNEHPDLKDTMSLHRANEYLVTYLAENKLSGFAVTKDKEIANVFNVDKKALFVLPKMIKQAIAAGGNWMNMFDGPLVNFYKKYGFVEYKRDKNWTAGGPDVVYMKLASTNESINAYVGYLNAITK